MNRTENCIEEKLVSEIGTKYSSLRFIHPGAEALIEKSITQYGQMSPVVCAKDSNGVYELIDGFKRLRIFRKLNKIPLRVMTVQVSRCAHKAAIIQLNRVSKTINDIEEAMVLHSLVQEDQLTQIEISTLIGRHKTWVSRRISLIEKLDPEILKEIGMGLVKLSIGRELAKLPRGNQLKALASIQKHRIDSKSAAKLACILHDASKQDCLEIFENPWKFLKKDGVFPTKFGYQLMEMQRFFVAVSQKLGSLDFFEIKSFSELIKETIISGEESLKKLKTILREVI